MKLAAGALPGFGVPAVDPSDDHTNDFQPSFDAVKADGGTTSLLPGKRLSLVATDIEVDLNGGT